MIRLTKLNNCMRCERLEMSFASVIIKKNRSPRHQAMLNNHIYFMFLFEHFTLNIL